MNAAVTVEFLNDLVGPAGLPGGPPHSQPPGVVVVVLILISNAIVTNCPADSITF